MSSLTARIAVLALVVVTTGGSTVRCSSGNLDGILDPGGPAFATTLVLRDAAGTPRSEFAPGRADHFRAERPQPPRHGGRGAIPGRPLPPGDYEARGVLVFPEFAGDPTAAHELGSTLEPLVIR